MTWADWTRLPEGISLFWHPPQMPPFTGPRSRGSWIGEAKARTFMHLYPEVNAANTTPKALDVMFLDDGVLWVRLAPDTLEKYGAPKKRGIHKLDSRATTPKQRA